MSQLNKKTELENRVMFCHHRNDAGENFTVAYRYSDDKTTNTFQVLVGYAFCSDKDQYCKGTGRNISEGRLKAKPSIIDFPSRPTNKQIVKVAIEAGLDDYGNYTLVDGGSIISV